MNQIYINLLYAVITAGVPCLSGGLFAGVKHFIGSQKRAKIINTFQTKSHLASEDVLFAEDAFKALGGLQKFLNAKESLIGRLNSCGIPVTADEAETLIRVAYQTAKNEFNADVKAEVAG